MAIALLATGPTKMPTPTCPPRRSAGTSQAPTDRRRGQVSQRLAHKKYDTPPWPHLFCSGSASGSSAPHLRSANLHLRSPAPDKICAEPGIGSPTPDKICAEPGVGSPAAGFGSGSLRSFRPWRRFARGRCRRRRASGSPSWAGPGPMQSSSQVIARLAAMREACLRGSRE